MAGDVWKVEKQLMKYEYGDVLTYLGLFTCIIRTDSSHMTTKKYNVPFLYFAGYIE